MNKNDYPRYRWSNNDIAMEGVLMEMLDYSAVLLDYTAKRYLNGAEDHRPEGYNTGHDDTYYDYLPDGVLTLKFILDVFQASIMEGNTREEIYNAAKKYEGELYMMDCVSQDVALMITNFMNLLELKTNDDEE
jgi:hypothetical protein